MGYRNSIWIIEKEKADSFRGKTFDELKSFEDLGYFNDEVLIGKNGGTLAIIVGKNVNKKLVEDYLSPFFLDEKTDKYANDEDECKLFDLKGLQFLATYYKNKIINRNNEMLDLFLKDPTAAGKKIYDCLNCHYTALDSIDKPTKNQWCLCNTWILEYDIWNMMYLLKVIDQDKYYLIWRGG